MPRRQPRHGQHSHRGAGRRESWRVDSQIATSNDAPESRLDTDDGSKLGFPFCPPDQYLYTHHRHCAAGGRSEELPGTEVRISTGSPISRTSQPGAALSTSRSSSTCLRDALWAGGCRPPCARTVCWMRWSRRFMMSAEPTPCTGLVQHSDAAVAIARDAVHGSPRRRRQRAVGRQPRRCLVQSLDAHHCVDADRALATLAGKLPLLQRPRWSCRWYGGSRCECPSSSRHAARGRSAKGPPTQHRSFSYRSVVGSRF